MSSWDFMPKSGIYDTGSKSLCLFCFCNYKIDFCTKVFALDLSSLVIVRANNISILSSTDMPQCVLKVYSYMNIYLIC